MTKILIADDVQGWLDYHSKIINWLYDGNCTIITASSAAEGYQIAMEHIASPFDIIITDLQMEPYYEPDYAGEWLIKQIKTLHAYYKTKFVIISAAYNIEFIAKNLGVDFIRKSTARNFPDAYSVIK